MSRISIDVPKSFKGLIILALLVSGAITYQNYSSHPLQISKNTSEAASTTPPNMPLIQKTDLTYVGAFRLPQDTLGSTNGFDYADKGFAYNPTRNSLFINGHTYEQKTAEITIPQPSTSSNLASLPVATALQNFADITEGHLANIGAGGSVADHPVMGGLMVHNDKLIGTAYGYYDAGSTVQLSHFTSGTTLAQGGDYKGMYRVGTLNPAFYGGYMAQIPSEWQASFGGPALTGNCCLSIITRTSFGPAAFVFNPDDLGVKNPVPATPLVYYDDLHPNLGTWEGNGTPNLYFNMVTNVSGVVFPTGTSTVLFFGEQGTGIPCYGSGGTSGGDCYDPSGASKGGHAYPYKSWVWAYSADDLLAVKNSQKNPWDVKPYAVWELTSPFESIYNTGVTGVAYNPTTQMIYVSEAFQDGDKPVIAAFKINTPSGAPTPTPTSSPSPTVTPKIGDLNNDGIVNSFDWAYMNSKWYTNDSVADINKDGIVNTIDFSMMNQNWLK